MRNICTLFTFILLSSTFGIAQNLDTLQASVYFDFDKDQLTTRGLETLNGITGGKNVIQIEIFGHTDNVGNPQYNLDLSQRRANSVKQFFTNEGYHSAIFKIKFYGEDLPLKPNETENDKAINRRVDVLIIMQDVEEKMPIEEPIINNRGDFSWLKGNDNQVETLLKELETPVQSFIVSRNDTMIVTEGGMIVQIPQNAFQCDCDANTPIEVKIQETLSLSDALRNNMMTMNDKGQPMKTGGMANITAQTASGGKVQLRRPLKVLVPTNEYDEGMRQYTGSPQTVTYANDISSTQRNEIIWRRTGGVSLYNDKRILYVGSGVDLTSPLCCEEDCVERKSKFEEWRMKKFQPQAYKVYMEGIQKGIEQVKKNCIEYKALRAAVLESRRRFAANNKNQSQNYIEATKSKYFNITLQNLGYFNCDYYPFENVKAPMVTMRAKVPNVKGVDVFFISKKYNMITRGNSRRQFKVIKGEKVILLGIGVRKDKTPMLAFQEVTAESQYYSLEFKPTTKEEIAEKMAILDADD